MGEYCLHGGCCTAYGKARRATLPAGVTRGQLGPLAVSGALGICQVPPSPGALAPSFPAHAT